MKRFRTIGAALLAILVLSAVAASMAQAEGYWTITGTRLAQGKTHNFTAKQVTSFTLNVPALGIVITCKKLKLKEGVLLGSNPGSAGTSDEVVVFEECKLEAGNGAAGGCKLKSPTLTTRSLKDELVESEAGGLLTLFSPAVGTSFILLQFEGASCLILESNVTGKVLAENTNDKEITGGEEKIIKLGELVEAHSWNLRFPSAALTKYVNAKGEKITIAGLLAFGEAAIQTGTALTLLANAKGETEEVLWSPLP